MISKSISKSIIIKVRLEKLEEFQQTVFALQSKRKEVKGKKFFRIDEDPENQNVFHLTYEFNSHHESESYFKSDEHRVLVGALKTLCEQADWK